MIDRHFLPLSLSSSPYLARRWLTLAVSALGAGTMLAVLLIASRMPGLGHWLGLAESFRVALVLHVNLTVWVWYLCFACFLVYAYAPLPVSRYGLLLPYLALVAVVLLLLAAAGSPARAVLNNYFPVLESPFFFLGMLLFGVAVLVVFAQLLRLAWQQLLGRQLDQLLAVMATAALMALLAAILLGLAYLRLQHLAALGHGYYELLFWAVGHLFQSVYSLLMAVVWLILLRQINVLPGVFASRVLAICLLVVLAGGVASLYVGAAVAIDSLAYRQFFTRLMVYSSWLPALVPAWLIVRARSESTAAGAAFVLCSLRLSLLVFVAGLGVGALIRADNLLVPAHYHGTTGGVNLAFLALALSYVISRLDSREWSANSRALTVYALGLLAMVAGLAIAGGLGVARKVAGHQQLLSGSEEVWAMWLAGAGAALALLGIYLLLRRLVTALFGASGNSAALQGGRCKSL